MGYFEKKFRKNSETHHDFHSKRDIVNWISMIENTQNLSGDEISRVDVCKIQFNLRDATRLLGNVQKE